MTALKCEACDLPATHRYTASDLWMLRFCDTHAAEYERRSIEVARKTYQVSEPPPPAALVASAPQLLAACEALLSRLPDLWGDEVIEGELTIKVDTDAVQAALDAIKAAGRRTK